MAIGQPDLRSAVFYRDPKAALTFLEAAFGFELFILIEDQDGNLAHSEMRFGDSVIMVGSEWTDDCRSPVSVGGKNTQLIHIHLKTDVNAHCEHARAAGAKIIMEPQDQFYGDRTYRCKDPEGHIWVFGQTVKAVSREEAEQSTGLKITGWM